jgi:hypothetical protein
MLIKVILLQERGMLRESCKLWTAWKELHISGYAGMFHEQAASQQPQASRAVVTDNVAPQRRIVMTDGYFVMYSKKANIQ